MPRAAIRVGQWQRRHARTGAAGSGYGRRAAEGVNAALLGQHVQVPVHGRQADPAAGQKVATKCQACHDFTKGGPNRVGPNLWGVVGGPSAHKDDYNYDDAIKNLKITWTFENLDKYLTSPKTFAPGTKMTFPGLPKAQDRANLLRWLRDQSDNPVPLPQ